MSTTREEGIAKMKAFAARQPTLTLCGALDALDGPKLSDEERLSRAVVMDVLCERHPEAEAAAEEWAEDESTVAPRGLAEVITEAARNAATERVQS
jgi:hypothetical protein